MNIKSALSSKLSALSFLSIASLLVGMAIASCTGCATTGAGPDPAFVQKMINAAGLAPNFRGDVTLNEHVNAPGGVGLDVTLTDLRQVNGVWVWSGLTWSRHGVWTGGTLTITPRPPAAEPAR